MDAKNVIKTFQGHHVNLLSPRPETIKIDDIAHALSCNNMFGCHYPVPLSVALHCIRMVEWVEKRYGDKGGKIKLHALLSRASEAYIPNVPSVLKKENKEYYGIEQTFMDVIFKKFGIEESEYADIIDKADKAIMDVWTNFWLHGQADSNYTYTYVKKTFLEKYGSIIRQIEEEKREKEGAK